MVCGQVDSGEDGPPQIVDGTAQGGRAQGGRGARRCTRPLWTALNFPALRTDPDSGRADHAGPLVIAIGDCKKQLILVYARGRGERLLTWLAE